MSVLEFVGDEFEDASKILERGGIPTTEWNPSLSVLHAASRAGQIQRMKSRKGWTFAKLGVPSALPELPRDPNAPPSWTIYPEWTPKLGPSFGVFDARPPGEHCIWSVRWGGVAPEYQIPIPWILERMELPSIWFECRDVAQRQCSESAHAATICMSVSADPNDENWPRWEAEAKAMLRAARLGYAEAIAPWDIGPRVRRIVWRKGWEGPHPSELERRLNGQWFWKGRAVSGFYDPPPISRQHEAMAAAAVREANTPTRMRQR